MGGAGGEGQISAVVDKGCGFTAGVGGRYRNRGRRQGPAGGEGEISGDRLGKVPDSAVLLPAGEGIAGAVGIGGPGEGAAREHQTVGKRVNAVRPEADPVEGHGAHGAFASGAGDRLEGVGPRFGEGEGIRIQLLIPAAVLSVPGLSRKAVSGKRSSWKAGVTTIRTSSSS